ncbi:phosphoglucomutase [Thermogladius sp. KZ2Tp1]|uniref:phosphoglucomutase n=1 Tax=Thermogladius sp. KZ2Tp1 TaxID=3136289 RepID=UPI003DA99C3C
MRLFGTAGIRLRYPGEIDPVLCYRIGLAVSRLGLSREAFIVHDSRTTSHVLTLATAAGLMAGGVDVYLVGLAPTPVAAYAAKGGRGVGVSVTASHNPPEYNGLKFYDPEGFEFVRGLEKEVEEAVFNKAVTPLGWSEAGRFYTEPGLVDDYVEDLYELARPRRVAWRPVLVVDLANGAAGHVTPTLLRMMGATPLTVNANPDGFFPVRTPEPRKDVLESYIGLYSSVKPAAVLAHDGDADRLAVLDPVEGFIKQDRVIAFFIDELGGGSKGRVVVSVDTGRVVDEVAERHGLGVERYLLGKTHERVKEDPGVVIAAEPWKLIYPRWGPWVDGVLQAALISRVVVEEGKRFAEVLKDRGIKEYPWDRRSYKLKPEEKLDAVYRRLAENLRNKFGEPLRETLIDGYRYDYDDGSWFLVRRSGTEPKIRFYIEAPSRDKLRTMVETVESEVGRTVKEYSAVVEEVTVG